MIESVCVMKNGSPLRALTPVSSIAGELCHSLPPNTINEADAGATEQKFKISRSLKVIKICRYSCRQHTTHPCLITLSEDIHAAKHLPAAEPGTVRSTLLNVDTFKNIALLLQHITV